MSRIIKIIILTLLISSSFYGILSFILVNDINYFSTIFLNHKINNLHEQLASKESQLQSRCRQLELCCSERNSEKMLYRSKYDSLSSIIDSINSALERLDKAYQSYLK